MILTNLYTYSSHQLSQYISTSNTTTTTSTNNAGSELEPPSSAPPLPPPPPLNIPPSRARRQLAARLALHQKTQEAASSESNGESSAFPASTGRLNGINLDPFADHDSDDDLEIEGGPSDAWALPGYDNIGRSEAPSGFDDNFDADHVGAPFNDTPSSSSTAPLPANSFVELTPLYGSAFESSGTISDGGEVLQTTDSESGSSAAKPRSISPLKSGFSSLWPFGQGSKGLHKSAIDEAFGIVNREETSQNQNENLANDFFDQTDTDSSDDGFDGIGEKEASGAFDGKRDKGRRPSLTTEAKSRTSLDDDDEEIEIVTAKADVKAATGANLAHVSAGKTEDKAVESQKKAEETLNHDKGT